MILKLRMTSGKELKFSNDKYKTLSEWIKGNLIGNAIWFQIDPNKEFIIKIDCIEYIEVIKWK